MDIAIQSEIFLRNSGYETWPWHSENSDSITCFESSTIMGFVYVFLSAEELISSWESEQRKVLNSHSALFRAAGDKAWNVYSVFLAGDKDCSRQRKVEQIEENFSLTRKIARSNIHTEKDIESALLPFVTIKARPMKLDDDFEVRFRAKLNDISGDVLDMFLKDNDYEKIAKMLLEKP